MRFQLVLQLVDDDHRRAAARNIWRDGRGACMLVSMHVSEAADGERA